MTAIFSLALLAIQAGGGFPAGTQVEALHRFPAEGDYTPQAQTIAVDGDDTYVISSAESLGMKSWTRTRLDAQGQMVWSHTDYQALVGPFSPVVGEIQADAWVAPSAGLLISTQSDAREEGTYRIMAHSLADGSEVWSLDPVLAGGATDFSDNVNAELLVDDADRVLYQVQGLFSFPKINRIDLATGALLTSQVYLGEFFSASISEFELSEDGQRMYLGGTVSTFDPILFTTIVDGVVIAIDLTTGQKLWQVIDPERQVAGLAVEPGGSDLSVVSSTTEGARRLRVLDGPTGAESWSQLLSDSDYLPSELSYTVDGSALILASGRQFFPFSIAWQPGGSVESFDSQDGSLLWERAVNPAGVEGGFIPQRVEFAVGSQGALLWSYTSAYDEVFDPVETVTLEGLDVATGALLFTETVNGRNYSRVQAYSGEFVFVQTEPIAGDDLEREPVVRRIAEISGQSVFEHEPEASGPLRSFIVNFEVTDDGSRAAMMRYIEGLDPRLELMWIDMATGQTLWSDVLPATQGLNISDNYDDCNRQMLLSPDDAVLISVVRGDGGSPYLMRVRAYEAESGTLLWTEEFDKQKGVSLFSGGLTRTGNRGLEVTDAEVFLAGNVSASGGMLLTSLDLWTGVENWAIDAEPGTVNWPYSTHVALDGDSVYSIFEAPLGALATPGRRIVRVDRETGAILSFIEIVTNGFITRLFAKGGGEPLLISDNTVTGSIVRNTRLIAPDLSAELDVFPVAFGGVPLASLEGYLVDGGFQAGDTPEAGEANVDVALLSQLEPAPGGVPSSVQAIDRGQLLIDLGGDDPATGEAGSYLRVWDAADGAFMWSAPLFAGTDWNINELTYLEQLPGRAGFIAVDRSTEAEIPAPEIGAPTPVVQVLDLPELVVEPTEISLSAGGPVDYWLRRNTESAGPQAYLLLGGEALVADGPLVDGVQLPFAATDSYSLLTLLQANQGIFVDTLGLLDDSGNAEARINSPANLDPMLAGLSLHYTWLTIDLVPFALVTEASHTVEVLFVP